MKKFSTKIIALCLCVLLAAGVIATNAFALGPDGKEAKKQEEAVKQNEPEKQDGSETMAAGDTGESGDETGVSSDETGVSGDDTGVSKDETVYVLAGADGSVQKIIVSDWLKNSLGNAAVSDQSELTDVENVEGDETYTMNGDNMRVWNAQGNDIYYQGNIKKDLPVDLSVSYMLDGKPISADDLVGKSGRVTIRFDYQDKQYETVEINGKQEKIYVPFTMLTGVFLDDDVFANVEVTNGKLINDGGRTVVIGIAFPGLQENLALSKDKLEIPDYVEITADVSNFRLDMTMTLAANGLFSEFDADGFDSISELDASMDQLTSAMDQLLDGSSQLYDGIAALLEKSEELTEGIDQLAVGSESLKKGAESLDAGAAELGAGAARLSEGLNTLASNNGSLNGGAGQVFNTLLSMANTQLAAAGLDVPTLTIENYAQVLTNVIASLDENAVYGQAQSQVAAAVEAQRGTIEQQVAAVVQEQVIAQVTAAVKEEVATQVTQTVRSTVAEQVIQSVLQMDKASYDAAVSAGQVDAKIQGEIDTAIEQQMQSEQMLQQIQAGIEGQMATQPIQEAIAANVNEQMQSEAINQTIAQQTEQQIQKACSEQMASEAVQAQLTAAAQGAKSVIQLKSSLDSYNAFYLGLQSYTAGVADAAAGAGTLKTGTDDLKTGASQLTAGASQLSDGILTLKNGTPALADGITQLRDGSMQLSDGLKEFNEEGIQKLVDAVDGDLDGLLNRLRATKEVSRRYKNFAGASEDMDGQVKFIYRTDAIE